MVTWVGRAEDRLPGGHVPSGDRRRPPHDRRPRSPNYQPVTRAVSGREAEFLLHYRGVHRLNRDEQGRRQVRRVHDARHRPPGELRIEITAEKRPPEWPDRDKFPMEFILDEPRCIYCGMCEEACPCDAIESDAPVRHDRLDPRRDDLQQGEDARHLRRDEGQRQGPDPDLAAASSAGPRRSSSSPPSARRPWSSRKTARPSRRRPGSTRDGAVMETAWKTSPTRSKEGPQGPVPVHPERPFLIL